MKKDKVHIISHTHWDREWYINSKFVNEWLPPFFDGLFDMMDKEPQYQFVLDGQMSMVDDCCVELEKLGRSTDRFLTGIKKYASQGRLILGPYYLQPDWQLISGEAIIRNMEMGISGAASFGGGSSTGWLLDNFGQIAQAPQIHKLFGMKGLVVWRGVGMEPDNVNSEFRWVSPDGTSMTTVYLLSSYRNAMRLADFPDIINDRIRNETCKIREFSRTGNIILMNGYDQEMEPDNILPYLRESGGDFGDFTVAQGTPDGFMKEILASDAVLQELHGPLYSGRYISVFPGILSARIYLKQMNEACQRKLERYIEPLASIGYLLGYDYPTDELAMVWKKLLKNHPHDSICGVGVDDVHSDMEQNFSVVEHDSNKLLEAVAGRLCGAVDTTAFGEATTIYTIFNTLLHAKRSLVELPCGKPCEVRTDKGVVLLAQPTAGGVLVEVELPAMGCLSVGTYPTAVTTPAQPQDCLRVDSKHLTVDFAPDGTLEVLDRRTGKRYTKLGYLEDSADSGDEYNYSFITGDVPLTTLGQQAEITVVEHGELRTVVRVSRTWQLPQSLVDNHTARSASTVALPVITDITIEHDSDVVRFVTHLRNLCKDHRIRAVFPTRLATDTSYAHTQFDVTSHPIVSEAFDNASIPDKVARIVIGARESLPITQFPQCDFVAVSDGVDGVAILNRGLPEYEVLPNDTAIALTLFRSVGWLARTDLNTRIGDAGPEIFVPEAQCLRDMTFQYAFHPFAGAVSGSPLLQVAEDWAVSPVVCSNTLHTGTAATLSLGALASSVGVGTTACKLSPYSGKLLLRLHNAGDSTATQVLTMSQTVTEASCTNLLGTSLSAVEPEATLRFDIAPGQICTLELAVTCMDAPHSPVQTKVYYPVARQISFEQYVLPPVVTQAEVDHEQARASTCEQKYQTAVVEYDACKHLLSDNTATTDQRLRAATAYTQLHSYRRAMLEAQLSLMFTQAKLVEAQFGTTSTNACDFRKQVEQTLRDISYQLNLARISKRVSEYLQDYYQQRA